MRKLAIALSFVLVAAPAYARDPILNTESIEQITGVKGTGAANDKAFTLFVARDDVKVMVDGRAIAQPLNLGSRVFFMAESHDRARLMGQFALFADEVNPVLTVGFENGLEIMALHDRFFYDEPRVYVLEVAAELPSDKLTQGVRRMLDRVRQIRRAQAQPATGFGGPRLAATNKLSAALFESGLGVAAADSGAMGLKFEILNHRGGSALAAFTGTDDMAAVNGSFVVRRDDLQMLIRALRHWDLTITGIHTCTSNPRGESRRSFIEVDYYGAAKPPRLAQAVRTALDTLKK